MWCKYLESTYCFYYSRYLIGIAFVAYPVNYFEIAVLEKAIADVEHVGNTYFNIWVTKNSCKLSNYGTRYMTLKYFSTYSTSLAISHPIRR